MDDWTVRGPDRPRARAAARDAPARGRALRRRRVRRARSTAGAPVVPAAARLVRDRARRSSSAIFVVHPSPATDLVPRRRAIAARRSSSASLYGAVGTAIALGVALLPLPPAPVPGRLVVPGRAAERGHHRVHRRGRVPRRRPRRCSLLTGLDADRRDRHPGASLYALATRLGAPGPRTATCSCMALAIGLAGGWVDRGHRRHRARRSSATRSPGSRSSCRPATPASPAARPRGRGDRGQAPAAGGLARRSGRGSRRPAIGERRTTPARRPRRHDGAEPRRPSALYVHVPFCVSLCPYCDFVVVAGAAARGPTNRIAAFVAALRGRDRAAGRRARRAVRAAGHAVRPPLDTVYLGGGTPSLLPADVVAAAARARPRPVRRRRRRGGHARGQPGARRARRPGGARRGPGSPGSRSAPRASTARELRRLGRRHRPADVARRGRRGARRRHRLDQPGPAVRRPGRLARRPGWTPSRPRSSLEPDHLSLYALTLDDPDAEGLTGPGRRPPADDRAARAAGATRARPGAGRGPGRRPVPPRRPSPGRATAGAATRSATGRGPATRAATTSPTGSAGRTRRSGPGAHAFDGATRRWNAARLGRYVDALTPPAGSGRPRPAAGRLRDARRRDGGRRGRRSSGSGRTAACRGRRAHEPPLADVFGWALAAELLTIDEADRIVLTTRGRLLSNELFARLV